MLKREGDKTESPTAETRLCVQMRFKGHEFYHVLALSHLWCVLYILSLFSLYYTTLDKLCELLLLLLL